MIDSPRFHFNLTKIGANQMVKVTKISVRGFEKQNEQIRLYLKNRPTTQRTRSKTRQLANQNSKPDKALFSARAENSRGQ